MWSTFHGIFIGSKWKQKIWSKDKNKEFGIGRHTAQLCTQSRGKGREDIAKDTFVCVPWIYRSILPCWVTWSERARLLYETCGEFSDLVTFRTEFFEWVEWKDSVDGGALLGRSGDEVKRLKPWEQVLGEAGPRAKAGPASLPPLWITPRASAREVARGDETACGGAGDDAVSSYNAGIIGKHSRHGSTGTSLLPSA